MNTYSLKDKYNQSFKPWLFAITVCILSNLIFYFLFSMSNQEKDKTSSALPKIVMLPLDNNLLSNNLKNVLEWMNDENPTLIAAPSLQYGYSSMLLSNNSIDLQKPEVFSINYKDILVEHLTLSKNVSTIPLNFLTISEFFNQLTNIQTAFLPPLKPQYPIQATPAFPKVSELYTGMTIPISFYSLGINNSIIAKFNPLKYTVILLYVPEDKSLLLSGKIIESSGVSELDFIALNNLIINHLSDKIWNKYKGNNIILKIEWAPLFCKTKEN